MYVQEVQSEDFPSRHLKEVCACWFQKPGGGKADFEVLFFAAEGSRPAMEPYAKVQATAKGLGEGKRDARWHVVDVSGVSLPEGTSYIGVRWQPTKEPRLFVCSDQSAETPRRKGFFGEDRSRGWIDLETTADPIFIPHRALMIRSVAHPEGLRTAPRHQSRVRQRHTPGGDALTRCHPERPNRFQRGTSSSEHGAQLV